MGKKRPTLVVRNVLLNTRKELLLGLRSDTLRWELPGGKVDDETVAEAGRREQLEETDMELCEPVVCLGCADVHSQKHLDRRFVDIFLLWHSWRGFPRVMEENNLQWRWFPVNDLPPEKRLQMSTAHFVRELLGDLLDTLDEDKPVKDVVDEPGISSADEIVTLGPVS